MKNPPRYMFPAIMFGVWLSMPLASVAQTELLKNGNFQSKLAGWELESPPSSEVTADVVNGDNGRVVVINVPAATAHSYDVKLIQPIYHVPAGASMTLTFRARGERQISVALRAMGGKWEALWTEKAELSPEWNEYSFEIPASDWPGSLRFDIGDLGASASEYQFADVSLKIN